MNEKQVQSLLREKTQQLAPGSGIDLWPGIETRVAMEMDQMGKTTQGRKPILHPQQPRYPRLRLAAIGALVVLSVIGVYFMTPQGQVTAQAVVHFFTRSQSNQLPLQAWQLTPVAKDPNPTADPASILDAHLSIEEAQQQADFDVLVPAWIPEILDFSGASYDQESQTVRLFYQSIETNGLVFRQEQIPMTDTCDLCGKVGADAAIEEVSIGGVPGEYAEGVWKLTDTGSEWVSDPYLKTMRWQENGMVFELLYMGSPEALSKEDMIEIAGSIQ